MQTAGVYRLLHKRYVENCVLERDRFGRVGVMFWGAFNFNVLSQLVIMNVFDRKIAAFHCPLKDECIQRMYVSSS